MKIAIVIPLIIATLIYAGTGTGILYTAGPMIIAGFVIYGIVNFIKELVRKPDKDSDTQSS